MAQNYAVLGWQTAPDSDLALVCIGEEGLSASQPVVAESQLFGPSFLLCFRPDGLRGRWRDAWDALDAQGRCLDARLLSRIVLPACDAQNVPGLAAALEVTADAEACESSVLLAAHVAAGLLDRLQKMPLGVLLELETLLKPTRHALRDVVQDAVKAAMKQSFGAKETRLADLLPKEGAAFKATRREAAKEPADPIDVEHTCGIFAQDGALAANHPGYEYRPEQVRMVHEVCDAFNDALVLMVEAGTGTGKSMAYLAPAIAWAVRNDDPVIISTNTKNLQAQLFKKDLPFLEESLSGAFTYALIKGRANYLCLRKFLMVLENADRELSETDRVEILPLVSWLPGTETGDCAECAGFGLGMGSELWTMVSTRPDECLGPRCRHWRRCFVRRARAKAQQADIVVANHATVFMETGAQSNVLPDYRCIVFDEAHNLEDVATSCLATEVVSWRVPRTLRRLFSAGRRDAGAGKGLFANLRFELAKAVPLIGQPVATAIGESVTRAIGEFDGVTRTGDALFDAVAALFDRVPRYVDRIRYDAENRPENWRDVAQDIMRHAEAISVLANRVEQIAREVESATEPGEGELRNLAETGAEVGTQVVQLRAMVQALEMVLKAEDDAFVYWAERGRTRRDTALCAAPLDIAKVMDEAVYSRARTVVITSATLTAGSSFDFMRDRLGARGPVSERVRTAALGSSFDFASQAFVAVPLFLPEPRSNGPDFVGPFTDLSVDVLRCTQGRGLVLFTSHSMLRQAADRMKDELGDAGIAVLAQGIDGARDRLLAEFKRDIGSVLLGTQSFWEGVDVQGEALSCLILAKLPFRPHTDPIVQARCELLERQGRNPFMDYMVPDAVLRLKQGFGRLIRSRQDRGVVVICDTRVVTKRYGRAFLESLPVKAKAYRGAERLVDALGDFLGS